ncbi:Uncharacterised protein [BD1-7 clade bacterium]|uniref:Uncharacterized protein n=1 Tax=BD1-7 clade bacterium TaxID=2029982 RepID=A0A5S9PZ01_9GAMM|nr:Uncharacterised protein [BD1-7 clade bacterium]CAA0110013.1 Uncharacterised protein [BD1-7 clade bacterium]
MDFSKPRASKGWKTFAVSLALIAPAGIASAANCKVPDNFDNIRLVLFATSTITGPEPRPAGLPDSVFLSHWKNGAFTSYEIDKPEAQSHGVFDYISRGDIGIIRGTLINTPTDTETPFTNALTCRTDKSGFYSYSASGDSAGGNMGRYLILPAGPRP